MGTITLSLKEYESLKEAEVALSLLQKGDCLIGITELPTPMYISHKLPFSIYANNDTFLETIARENQRISNENGIMKVENRVLSNRLEDFTISKITMEYEIARLKNRTLLERILNK